MENKLPTNIKDIPPDDLVSIAKTMSKNGNLTGAAAVILTLIYNHPVRHLNAKKKTQTKNGGESNG